MSFFFQKQKTKAVSKPARVPAANKQRKETLNRLGCQACPLDKVHNQSPKMAPILGQPNGVYFLGEQPSESDDKHNVPYSGKVGNLLLSITGKSTLYSYDYTIRDFSGDSKSALQSGTTANWVPMECCRQLVVRSIEDAKPAIIVGLGTLPLQWMLNSTDMVGLRGRVFAVQVGKHKCWFLPTYHPQFIIEKAFNPKEPLHSKLGHCLKFDLKHALDVAQTLPPPEIEPPQAARAGIQAFNGQGRDQLAKLLALISEARNAPIKAIDIETSHLRPYAANARLLTMAISYDRTNLAFAVDHAQAGWLDNEKLAIYKAVSSVLQRSSVLVAHNAPFEIEWLAHKFGRDCIFHDSWECTMMQAHFLDERRGHRGGNDDQYQANPYQALDFLTKQHFGLAYKSEFKLDRKNMAEADLDETLLYNGSDTKYTLRLYHAQDNWLKQYGLHNAYLEAAPRQASVALMQSIGIDIDRKQNKLIQRKLDVEIKEIEAKIQSYEEVKSFTRDYKLFNPASTGDVLRLLKNYHKVGQKLVGTDGKESVDKSVLSRINLPIGEDIETFRNRSKLKSTYVDAFEYGKGALIWPDGKIHPSFNTTFSETGRTSSDEPNQQNWPNRNDKWVRKQIIAPPGHVLVAFDYGQLEACTAAMCTKDKVLVKSLWEDYDIHMEWTHKAAEACPEFIERYEGNYKKARSIIKNKLVFPAMFGASNKSVAGYLNIPQEPVDKLMKEFWRTFDGLYKWQKTLLNRYYDQGFVESPTGRSRRFPLTKNQAINYPIQSVACDIVCRAMCELSVAAASTGKWHLHPIMNIHDDLTFCIPEKSSILEEAIETIYRTMLTPGYDFINVPLSVSCSVGPNWLEMDEIGKFWSHKDI